MVTLNGRNGLLTSQEVAELLNIHINTVRRWSNSGTLRSLRIGPRKDRRFEKEEIFRFLQTEHINVGKT